VKSLIGFCLAAALVLAVGLAPAARGQLIIGPPVLGGGSVTAPPRPAKTWYVDPVNGNDSTGTGSQGQPFKTIGYRFSENPADGTFFVKSGALGVANDGDTIHLLGGTNVAQFVQLWSMSYSNGNGISLIGDGPQTSFIIPTNWDTGSAGGQNIIQPGNNSYVADITVLTNANFGATWFNPCGINLSDTWNWYVDAYQGGTQPGPMFNATNVVINNLWGQGWYDGYYFAAQQINYDVVVIGGGMQTVWDARSSYGFNTNTINRTRFYNFVGQVTGASGQAGNVCHACDLHGGIHESYNCTYQAVNGGTNLVGAGFGNGGTYGVFVNDEPTGAGPRGQSNTVKFVGCTITASSTNANVTNGCWAIYSTNMAVDYVEVDGASIRGGNVTNVSAGFAMLSTNYPTIPLQLTWFAQISGVPSWGSFSGGGTLNLTEGINAAAGRFSVNSSGGVTLAAGEPVSADTIQDVTDGGNWFALTEGFGVLFDNSAITSDGSGNLTAASFIGSGVGLKGIPTTNNAVLNTNGVPVGHALVATNDTAAGRFVDGGQPLTSLAGNGSGLTNVLITPSSRLKLASLGSGAIYYDFLCGTTGSATEANEATPFPLQAALTFTNLTLTATILPQASTNIVFWLVTNHVVCGTFTGTLLGVSSAGQSWCSNYPAATCTLLAGTNVVSLLLSNTTANPTASTGWGIGWSMHN